MKHLAVLFSSSDASAWLQLVTLLMAAVHEEKSLSVLFRGGAVAYLQPDRMADLKPRGVGSQDAALQARLQKLGLTDINRLMDDIKASGEVKYFACSSSLAVAGLEGMTLVDWVDAVVGMPAYLTDEIARADHVLTF